MLPSLLTLVATRIAPTDYLIVPGARIGHVRLAKLVPAALGVATFSDGAAGSIWSTWKAADGNTLDIFAQLNMAGTGHAVVYARITSASFNTANHAHPGETWGHIKAHYPSANIRNYNSKQFGQQLSIMDDKARGISFEVTLNVAKKVANTSKCRAIWIHAKGVALDPAQWVSYEPVRP